MSFPRPQHGRFLTTSFLPAIPESITDPAVREYLETLRATLVKQSVTVETAAAGGGDGILIAEEFTNGSGVWDADAADTEAVWLTMIGGGGGGSGSNVAATGGGGGGGGESCHSFLIPVSGAMSWSVGSGGTGGTGAVNGSDGGTTSFGIFQCVGGHGGGQGANGGGDGGGIGGHDNIGAAVNDAGGVGTYESVHWFGGSSGGEGGTNTADPGGNGGGSGGHLIGGTAGNTSGSSAAGGGGGAATVWGSGGNGGNGGANGSAPLSTAYGAGGGGAGGGTSKSGAAGVNGYILIVYIGSPV